MCPCYYPRYIRRTTPVRSTGIDMQFVAQSKHHYKSVQHIDGTARVQIVKKDCESVIRPILEEWHRKTKCPMLLNTSLNIKGQPIVNNENDASEFEKVNHVKVF